jgi:hypothetical protein
VSTDIGSSKTEKQTQRLIIIKKNSIRKLKKRDSGKYFAILNVPTVCQKASKRFRKWSNNKINNIINKLKLSSDMKSQNVCP